MRTAAALLLLLAAVRADDTIEARLQWEPGVVGWTSNTRLAVTTEAPAGVTLPELGAPRFGVLRFGADTAVHVAIDTATDPRLVYLDSDRDGNLAEEKPRAVRDRIAVCTVLLFDNIPIDIHFGFGIESVGVSTATYRRGAVVLAGRVRDVAIVDGNADLRFDDPERDRLYVDVDGRGTLDDRARVRPGEPFAVRGQTFVARVSDPRGATVSFAPTSGRAAPLRYPPRHVPAAGVEPQDADRIKKLAKVAVSGSDPKRREDAVKGLHRMDAPKRAKVYANVLRSLRAESERDLCQATADRLGALGTPDSQRLLLRAYRDQSDGALRRRIYLGARAAPDGPARALVKAGLKDSSDLVRGYAIWDLWLLGDTKAHGRAKAVFEQPEPLVGLLKSAIRVLAYDGRDLGLVLRQGRWTNNAVWRAVFGALRRERGPAMVKAAVKELRHDSVRVRALAAELLAGVRGEGAAAALARAMRDEKDTNTIERMARAIAFQNDPRSIDVLVRLARKKDLAARSDVIEALGRFGATHPKVRGVIVKLLKDTAWESRVLALGVAEERMLKDVLANLAHAAWQVRLAAVHALRRIRSRDGIAPLVARLESEKKPRLRHEIGAALFSLTGQDFGEVVDAWQRWWAAHGEGFQVPAEEPRRPAPKGGTVARFYGLPVRSDCVCFVLDRSNSMGALDPSGRRTRMQTAVAEVRQAIARMAPADRVNVVFFDTAVKAWKDHPVPLTRNNRAALEKHLEAQKPGKRTNLYDALALALDQKAVDTIFLLSDGTPNEGRFETTDGILREVARRNRVKRIAIHAIAIGRDSDLLRALAERSGGVYARR